MSKIYENGITKDSVTGQVLQVGRAVDATDAPIVTAPVAAPTTTDLYGGLNNQTPEERAFVDNQGAADKLNANTPIDENAIRTNTINKFQAEIDAMNRVYAERRATETIAGNGRMGGVAAVEGRRGLLGSDFGIAQENIQAADNTTAINKIENERLLKEQGILGDARAYADTEIANKTAARKLSAADYIKFIGNNQTRRQTNSDDFAKRIYDAGTGDTTDFKAISNELGISVETLKNSYNTYKKSADKLKFDAATKLDNEKKANEQALLKEGYSYVKTPVERDTMKANGYHTVELNGKTYSKIPKTVTKDVKVGNTTYSITTDELGNVLNKTVVGTGTGKNTLPPKLNPEEKAFDADLKAAQKDLAKNGSKNWGKNYDYLANRYKTDPATLDELLNKAMYTN